MLASDLSSGGRNTVPLCQRKWSSEKLRCLLKTLIKSEVVVKCFAMSKVKFLCLDGLILSEILQTLLMLLKMLWDIFIDTWLKLKNSIPYNTN